MAKDTSQDWRPDKSGPFRNDMRWDIRPFTGADVRKAVFLRASKGATGPDWFPAGVFRRLAFPLNPICELINCNFSLGETFVLARTSCFLTNQAGMLRSANSLDRSLFLAV